MGNRLVGYVRKSNNGTIRISINKAAFSECGEYITSDGQCYIQLVISSSALNKVLNGERAVTVISEVIEEEE